VSVVPAVHRSTVVVRFDGDSVGGWGSKVFTDPVPTHSRSTDPFFRAVKDLENLAVNGRY
jgi:hypothetical protein